jgi:hypothetical protein
MKRTKHSDISKLERDFKAKRTHLCSAGLLVQCLQNRQLGSQSQRHLHSRPQLGQPILQELHDFSNRTCMLLVGNTNFLDPCAFHSFAGTAVLGAIVVSSKVRDQCMCQN